MRLELRRRKNGIRTKGKTILVVCICCLIAVFFAFAFLDKSEMLREVAQSELESIAYDIIGEIIEKELTREDLSYSELVKIERDLNGKIQSVTTDTQRLNLLKLRISNELSQIMLDRYDDAIKIPLGNLTGIDALTGVGPDVKFRIMWVSDVISDVSSTFESVGINQTRHRIMLDFKINTGMMFSGREKGVNVNTSICVAETIIVGEIPKFFSDK